MLMGRAHKRWTETFEIDYSIGERNAFVFEMGPKRRLQEGAVVLQNEGVKVLRRQSCGVHCLIILSLRPKFSILFLI